MCAYVYALFLCMLFSVLFVVFVWVEYNFHKEKINVPN